MSSHEVQGRRVERDHDGKPVDVLRLESASTSTKAFGIADAMAADSLTAWVFKTDGRAGGKTYRLLRVVKNES